MGDSNESEVFMEGYLLDQDIEISYGHVVKDKMMAGVYPEKYNLKDLGFVTPVKRQFSSNCWIYTAIAMMESFLLKKGIVKMNDLLSTDLSEMHMTYSMFDMDSSKAEYANPEGKKPKAKDKDGKVIFSYGGNRILASAYLTRASGCVTEITDPSPNKHINGAITSRKYDISKNKERRFLVTGIKYIEDSVGIRPDLDFIEDIKDSLMAYGAVGIGMHFDAKKYMTIEKAVTPNLKSYYSDVIVENYRGHAVTVVGWDDYYDKSHFKKTVPKNSGAFLIKNSHGIKKDNSGNLIDDGYFWLSYEDMNMQKAYCITAVREDFYIEPNICYRHDKFGMMTKFMHAASSEKVEFANVYTAGADEVLVDIGLYTITPCLATVTCVTGGNVQPIVNDYKLSHAGYHVYHLPVPLKLVSGSFKLTVQYNSMRYIKVFVPVEYKYNDEYDNIKVNKGNCFIDGEDMTDIISRTNYSYGYVPLRVMVKNNSVNAQMVKNIYNKIAVPASRDGRVDNLPNNIEGSSVTWRVEPYAAASYMVEYKALAVDYTITDAGGKVHSGIKNLTNNPIDVYTCAIIGTEPIIMRKLLNIVLSAAGPYLFTAADIAKGENTTILSGEFPVPGARVIAQVNGMKKSTVVGHDNKWQIDSLAIYNAKDGWNDNYKKSIVSVTIEDDNGIQLCMGQKELLVTCPYEKDETGTIIVVTAVGLVTAVAIAAGAYCCIKFGADIEMSSAMVPLLGGELVVEGEGFVIDTESTSSIFDEAIEVKDLTVRRRNVTAETENVVQQIGGVVKKIRKGGKMTGCTVLGDISNADGVGGLFYEGENVEITNCKVSLNVINNKAEYGGVTVKLNGKNKISGIEISGKVQADIVAGIATSIDETNVSGVSVNLDACGITAAAGIAVNATNVDISQVVVGGSYAVTDKEGIVGGIVGYLKDMSILKNCRVSARLSASRWVGGIAAHMIGDGDDLPIIENCYSACALMGTDANTIVCGISDGILGKDNCIKGCVSVCTHLSGSKIARIAWNNSNKSVAYDGMTCDYGQNFHYTGEVLEKAASFLKQGTYEELGWDFSGSWIMDKKDCFPLLKNVSASQVYDYPFAFPYLPENGLIFAPNQLITLYGVSHIRTSRMTWLLSPVWSGKTANIGNFICKDGQFYLEIGTLSGVGDYNLVLIAVIDGFKYEMPLVIKIQ